MNIKDYEEKTTDHLLNNSTYSKVSMETFEEEDLAPKYYALINELKLFQNKKQFTWLMDIKKDPGIWLTKNS